MTQISKQVQRVTDALLAAGAWKATLIVSPTEVVRATRRWYRRSRVQSTRRIEVMVTIGRPNYLEREMVKECKRAGESFPVRKIQLKFRKSAR